MTIEECVIKLKAQAFDYSQKASETKANLNFWIVYCCGASTGLDILCLVNPITYAVSLTGSITILMLLPLLIKLRNILVDNLLFKRNDNLKFIEDFTKGL